ncbi:MAG: glycosyltransferase family 2 protein [Halobacteriaceae archaeon]
MSGSHPTDGEDPVVSVVVPYAPEYTPAWMLKEAEESVRSQSVPTDLIVVEDAESRGPAWARNVGLDRAETRYVAFLDADDRWTDGKLRRQLDRMAETGAGLCLQGDPLSFDDFVYEVFVGGLSANTSALLVDADVVDARFEERLRHGEDNLYTLEAASQGGVCLCPDLFTRRRHSDSVTASPVDPAEFFAQDRLFATLVDDRVPAARPYLTIYYTQMFTEAGVRWAREGRHDRAVEYYLRALRVSPHPVTLWRLLGSLLRRGLP